MTDCPKCGSGDISGPRYYSDYFGHERLLYTCRRCGYATETHTLDNLLKESTLSTSPKN